MNRLAVFLLVVLIGVGLFLLRFGPFSRSLASSPPASPRENGPPSPGLGVSSCAASACHHGNESSGLRSAYTTWATRDPHAQAFDTLFNERSRAIQNNLNRSEPAARRTTADRNVVCLRCHAPGAATMSESVSAKLRREDGVGCESCHGPAEKWRDEHFRRERWQGTDAEKAALGFRPLNNPQVRAEVCVACHVAARGQEVDHDLIAAGHPRLQFELSSYLAALPAHWTEKGANAKPGFATRTWAVGQVVSAGADLRLLAGRAGAADHAWPEFAAHDCLACHHDLSSPRSRAEDALRGRTPGIVPANTWYVSLLPALAKSTGSPNIASLEPILDALARPVPDRARVSTLAESCLSGMASLQPSLDALDLPRPDRQDLVLATLDRALMPSERGLGWDDITQACLALAAWRRSVTVGKEIKPEDAAVVDGVLRRFREAFPSGYDTPHGSPAELERQLRAVVQRLCRK